MVQNTVDAIKELLDRRAKNYSNRPQTVVAGELMGLNVLLLMSLHADKQKKAQVEIDQITSGGSRLVTLEDRQNMPYLRALMQEVSRWHIVVPLSEGFHKGSVKI